MTDELNGEADPSGASTKNCPFCAEEILVAAIKCKHCAEMLDEPPAEGLPSPGKPGAPLPSGAGITPPPSKAICTFLAVFLPIGFSHFLMGYQQEGILHLIASFICWPVGVPWSWYDAYRIHTGDLKMRDGRELGPSSTQQHGVLLGAGLLMGSCCLCSGIIGAINPGARSGNRGRDTPSFEGLFPEDQTRRGQGQRSSLGGTIGGHRVVGARLVSRSDFGKDWPFTLESGEIICLENAEVLFRSPTGTLYAVNGRARGGSDLRDFEEIWRDDPNSDGAKVSPVEVIDLALRIGGRD